MLATLHCYEFDLSSGYMNLLNMKNKKNINLKYNTNVFISLCCFIPIQSSRNPNVVCLHKLNSLL